ncbi:MAG: WcaF family extracellular polysaccharide biosynthesis acetyltransferase [Bacteroidetes bacterium]|nr:WcaF family extracellular polysaccharide biosynthesis acetyltransferase [Bacteroidota bacterium]
MKTNLASFNNSHYKPGAGRLKMTLWYLVNALIINSFLPFGGLRASLLRLFGARVGTGVVLKPYINIKYPWNLEIGDHCWIGEQVWIDNLDKVQIGSHVCVSQGAMLLCGNHNYRISSFDLITGPITLEDGVWIGAKTVVCPGIVCHSHSVLSVGSIATRNLEAYTVYAGIPATAVRKREVQA